LKGIKRGKTVQGRRKQRETAGEGTGVRRATGKEKERSGQKK